MTTAEPTSAPARLIIGVTAHRELATSEVPRIEREVREFLLGLQAQFPELPLAVMSALAEGGDRLVARIALELGLALIAPLPLPRALYEQDFESESSRAEFSRLLDRAQAIELPLIAGMQREALGRGSADRSRHYAQLGVYISSHCQILLALWDGEPSEGDGGTSDVVRCHLEGEMPGLPLEDAPPNLLADDDSDLVYHIACARQRDANWSGPARSPRWLLRSGTAPDASVMPSAYRRMFGQLAEFNRDAEFHAASIARESRALLPRTESPSFPPGARAIEQLFVRADWLALHYRRRVHRSLLLLHLLALLTGLVFLIYSEFERSPGYVAAMLGFFLVGYGVTLIGERRQWHRRYLDYRVLAEGLRVQCYWVIAGVPTMHRVRFAYDSFLQKQDVELGWIRHVMRSANLGARAGESGCDAGLAWVIGEWVGTGVADGQLGYYRQRAMEREGTYRRTEALGRASLAISLLCALLLLLLGARMPAVLTSSVLLTMGLAALFAGVREAYSHKLADKELIKQYRFMARIFAGAAQRLATARTVEQKRNVLEALGQAALEEHAEWILVHRERPLEHNRLG
jgi:hypothetical protein